MRTDLATSTRHARTIFITVFVTLAALAVALAQPWSSPSAEAVFDAIGVREGASVCEIGAGDGELSLAAAGRVGPDGRVFTSELGDSRLQKLRDAVEASGLTTVTVVAGNAERTNFPDGVCDALFMRDVYHHIANPTRMNSSIAAALKPGARVAVVDFTPPGEEGDAGNRDGDGRHGVHPETVASEMKAAGFDVVSSDRGTRWFMVVLAKPRGQP
jgi:ubiquinone/menaquinone biosynthesis C-methylase UbiE